MVRIEGARRGLVQISVERKFIPGINEGSRKVSTRSMNNQQAFKSDGKTTYIQDSFSSYHLAAFVS